MANEAFAALMRRVVTADDAEGKSFVLVDDGPSNADPQILFEIWDDLAAGVLDPRDGEDLGPKDAAMMPGPGRIKVRWTKLVPPPPDATSQAARDAARAHFASMGMDGLLVGGSEHWGMHRTETLDVICIVQGEVSLILDSGETRLKAGNVVIQRGVAHTWKAHGGPVLMLSVIIDRPLKA